MTTEIDSSEATAHFGDLLQRVSQQRETFIVTLHGKPTAVLSPVAEKKSEKVDVETLLQELDEFRAKVAARGSVLKPGETWNEFAREGLD